MAELRELNVAELGQIAGGSGGHDCVTVGKNCDEHGNNCQDKTIRCVESKK
jgi:hypothetical protein